MTDNILEAVKKLKPKDTIHSQNGLNTQQVYEIREAVLRGVKLRDIAKAVGVTLPGLYSKMGIWALHNLPTGAWAERVGG